MDKLSCLVAGGLFSFVSTGSVVVGRDSSFLLSIWPSGHVNASLVTCSRVLLLSQMLSLSAFSDLLWPI